MALTAVDRSLLQKVLAREAGSWNDFVDRFLGLIYHTIHYTAYLRSNVLTPDSVEDLAQEVLSEVVAKDYALLRSFRGKSSLATYLTVLARRICARELAKRVSPTRRPLPPNMSGKMAKVKLPAASESAAPEAVEPIEEPAPRAAAGIETLDLLQKLIRKLPSREREVVRLFYFEGRSYEEISATLDLPVKSIAPILKRARQLLRQYEDDKA